MLLSCWDGCRCAIILKKNGVGLDIFDKIIGPDLGLARKPAPDLFLHALKEMNVSASDALVFEDTNIGLQAAKRAGIDSIFIGNRQNEGLIPECGSKSYTHKEILSRDFSFLRRYLISPRERVFDLLR